jgi:hypothetical protein
LEVQVHHAISLCGWNNVVSIYLYFQRSSYHYADNLHGGNGRGHAVCALHRVRR